MISIHDDIFSCLDKNQKKWIYIFYTPCMVSQILFQKSSANYLATRGFAQKGFAMFIFGHQACPILRIFLTFVQSKFKK